MGTSRNHDFWSIIWIAMHLAVVFILCLPIPILGFQKVEHFDRNGCNYLAVTCLGVVHSHSSSDSSTLSRSLIFWHPHFRGQIFAKVELNVSAGRNVSAINKQERLRLQIKKPRCLHDDDKLLLSNIDFSVKRAFPLAILSIGLWRPGLNLYMKHLTNRPNVTALEYVNVVSDFALSHFGLNEDSRFALHTNYSTQVIRRFANEGRKYDAIIVASCVSNGQQGVVCPDYFVLPPRELFSLLKQNGVLNIWISPTGSKSAEGQEHLNSIQALFGKGNCVLKRGRINQVLRCRKC